MKSVTKNTLRSAAVCICLTAPLATAQSSAGPVLWQDVRAGMTEAELRALHSSVVPSEQGVLVENNVVVAGMAFNAYFKMVAGRLQHVQLQSSSANSQNLVDALAAKYGAASSPYKCDSANVSANRCTGVWSAPNGVAVTLGVFNAPGMSVASIRYEISSSNGL